jgi:signal peptidase I
MAEATWKPRKPWVAVLLSLLCNGLGQIYCGHLVKGLALMLIAQLPLALTMAPAVLHSTTAIAVALAIPTILGIAVWVYAVVDSYRLASKAGSQYELREYNRGIVYVLFILTGIVQSLCFSPVLAACVRANVAEAFCCPTESMSPTLLKGDRFMVDKTLQRKQPHRGDIVVFVNPENRDVRFVKRVVGLPGDTVRVEGNDVYINGEKLKQRPIDDSGKISADADGQLVFESNGQATYQIRLAADEAKAATCPETKVPRGHCFVLGDDRGHSADSRRYGCVPLGDILGKAKYIYWPAKQWSRFGAIDEH